MTTEASATAYWIGKCPVKGCSCRLHIEVPMMLDRWTEVHHNHAFGTSREVPKSRQYPANPFGKYWMPSALAQHCIFHKREIRWVPVNGSYSESHKCDARCMNATGPNCECACGGANHGRAAHVELVFAEVKTNQLI